MKTLVGIVIFTFCNLNAQISLNDSRLSDAYRDLTNRIERNALYNGLDIKGSPYFDSKFKEAIVIYFGKPLDEKVHIRYNAFSDELEMNLSPNLTESDQALIKNNNIFCELDGVVFKYLPLSGGNKQLPKVGYVKEIYKGQRYSIYLRERKVYREAKKARTSLERSFPARFTDEYEWYFQKNNGPLEFIKLNKKTFKALFKSDLDHLDTFLKTKKGDFKDWEYLQKLVRFMDEIN